MRRVSAFVVSIAFLGTAKADDAADLKAMVGKYTVEKAVLGGQDLTEVLKDMRFEVMDGGKYTAQVGDEKDGGTFAVDAAKKPKEMDVKPTGGPQKGKLVKAIYKLDGDSLTICFDHEAGDRPKAFESKAGTNHLLVVYKRMK